MNVPPAIIHIISHFHPKYAFYAIGDNSSDQLGLCPLSDHQIHHQAHHSDEDDTDPPRWRYLPAMSSLCFHPDFVHSGDGNFFIKSIDDRIYSAGFNSYGSCGVGSSAGKVDSFTAITFPDDAVGSKVNRIDVISSGVYTDHTFIVTVNEENGMQSIFGFGSNLNQQLGFSKALCSTESTLKTQHQKHVISPQRIESLNVHFEGYGHRIVQIATGLEHSLFLTANGRVFSCGDNFHGQCGVISPSRDSQHDAANDENDGRYIENLQIIPLLYDIEKIACGAFHNLCIDQEHNLWTFGCNESGELGLGADNTSPKICAAVRNPHFSGNEVDIVEMKCGDMHSMVFTVDGTVYLFGANGSGQIGNGEVGQSVNVPFRVQDGEGLSELRFVTGDCGCNHTLLVSNEPTNDLYAFGANGYGQIGQSDVELKQIVPSKVLKQDIGISENVEIVKVIADDELTLVICAI